MEVGELILKSPNEVRKTPDLMAFYLTEYEKIYGKKPACAGCTFKTDWKKFVKAVNSPRKIKVKTMTTTDKTFKLKDNRVRILTYHIGKSPQRKYTNKLTDDFVVAYLTNGTKEQIEQRKKEFAVLPKALQKEVKKEEKKEVEVKAETKPKTTRKKRTTKKSK